MLDDSATEAQESTEDTIETVPKHGVESSLDETSVGEIPEDWVTTRLGSIAKETEYGLTESAEEYDPDKPRYVRTQDFNDFGGINQDSRVSLSRQKLKDGFLEMGDLLFARSGSVGTSLGKTYLYTTDDGNCCFGNYSIRYQLRDKGLNHKYISEYTLTQRYYDWVRRHAKTTAQSNINTSEYQSLLIPIPPLSEQRKIATVLDNIDQAIQKTEEILEQVSRIKKGVSQDLFQYGLYDNNNQDISLGEFPKNWRVVPFKDIIDSIKNGIYKRKGAYGGETPILKMGNMFDEMVFEGANMERLSIDDDESIKYRLKKGDILFARRSLSIDGAGKCILIGNLSETTVFESSIIRVRLKDGYEPMFYAQYFESPVGSNSIERIVTTTTPSGIVASDLINLLVPKPETETQKKIAEILYTHDRKITALEHKKKGFKRLKRGLMQDLFSGEVRTTHADIDIREKITKYG